MALDGDKISFLMKTARTNTSVDCGAVLKTLMPIVSGRGGGKADTAQGSGTVDEAKVKELVLAVEGALK